MPMTDFPSVVFAAALVALLAVAAASDLRSFRIPNWVSAAILALLLPAWAAGAALAPAAPDAALAAVVVFAPTYALWRLGMFGGGDVKLLTAAAAWSGCHGLYWLLVGTALSGGALSVVAMAVRALPDNARIRRFPSIAALGAKGKAVPYGVAILVGAGAVILDALQIPHR
jgi:prepilin peptidase CpaA